MIELIRAYPPAAPLIGDLLAKNLDWPGADEIAGRLAAMLPPEIKQGEAKGADPGAEAAKAQLAKLAQALQAAGAKIKALEDEQGLTARKLEIEAFEAQTRRMAVVGGTA